ncbi:Hypothetical protein GbCGDNIH7_8267 [Granulibacter bethesdensis]|nr:Hypothetical protein GbCGDNIH7_8267 [Granulibacter bethesdensis]
MAGLACALGEGGTGRLWSRLVIASRFFLRIKHYFYSLYNIFTKIL